MGVRHDVTCVESLLYLDIRKCCSKRRPHGLVGIWTTIQRPSTLYVNLKIELCKGRKRLTYLNSLHQIVPVIFSAIIGVEFRRLDSQLSLPLTSPST